MEAPSAGKQSPSSSKTVKEGEEAFCECAEGWTCVKSKTETAQLGKPFAKCGSSCTCVTDATMDQISNIQGTLGGSGAGKVFCKCDKGWSCVVSNSEGPDAGKTFFECGEGCICVIDETNAVKIACA